jgi:hypothetical protein
MGRSSCNSARVEVVGGGFAEVIDDGANGLEV